MNTNNNLIYLDNNRTTVIDPEVATAMQATNLLSADELMTKAKAQVAALVHAQAEEIVLTEGTSDAIAIGIRVLFEACSEKGKHIITSVTEHPAVLNACKKLESRGAEITYLPVNREGLVDVDDLKQATRPDTILLCLMAANNETGVMLPIEAVAGHCRNKHIAFFSDGSQFVGKQWCDVNDLGIDCLAFGSHKMYGPPGIGALFLSNRLIETNPLLKNLIAGVKKNETRLNSSLVAGFGMAAEIAKRDYWEMSTHISRIKNYFEHQLLDLEGLRINGSTRYRIYNTSNLHFKQAEKIRSLLSEFEFLSNHNRHSHVLSAMGLTVEECKNSFRFSFGKFNTLDEVKLLVSRILELHS
ncbi:MAG: aminotransferase class V-fold PLP-dependent enzyme [Bacteroidia bacterium]|nr:aminotransferase class V-fold PLP-dependent enzyme [Bacteroidia bacterium]